LIGIPILILLIKYIRDRRIHTLLISNIEKLKKDSDSMILIQNIQRMISGKF